MGQLLPRRGERKEPADEPRVLGLTESEAEDAFAALSSETARKILALLYDDPKPPAAVRAEIGTSLQNVHYHLEKLESADLIEPAGTDYSEKGNKMTVYAPTSEALVLVASEENDESLLKRAIGRIMAGIGIVAGGALTFGYAVNRYVEEAAKPPDDSFTVQTTKESLNAAQDASSGFDPVAVVTDPAMGFFVGGAFALVIVVAWWYIRST